MSEAGATRFTDALSSLVCQREYTVCAFRPQNCARKLQFARVKYHMVCQRTKHYKKRAKTSTGTRGDVSRFRRKIDVPGRQQIDNVDNFGILAGFPDGPRTRRELTDTCIRTLVLPQVVAQNASPHRARQRHLVIL